jgi:hypothetical protein
MTPKEAGPRIAAWNWSLTANRNIAAIAVIARVAVIEKTNFTAHNADFPDLSGAIRG